MTRCVMLYPQRSVQCLLTTVEVIRLQEHSSGSSELTCLPFLDLLHVARAAQSCLNPYAALFYAEAWAAQHRLANSGMFRSVDEICDDSDSGRALHAVLRNAYQSVGESDAVYGCGMARLLDPQSRVWYLEHCGRWDQVIKILIILL